MAVDSIRHHLWDIYMRDGELHYSLGNLTDAGWFWDATEADEMFLLFLYRLKRSKVPIEQISEIYDFENIQKY